MATKGGNSMITKDEALKMVLSYTEQKLKGGNLFYHRTKKSYTVDELYTIINQPTTLDSDVEGMKYDVLQRFTDLSRGKIFEYQGVKIFYNNEFETFALNDERNIIGVKVVYDLFQQLLKEETV